MASRALRAAQKARISALEAQCMHHAALIEEMREQYEEVSEPKLAGRAGALVTFDHHGWVRIKRHLLRKGAACPRAASAAPRPSACSGSGAGQSG